MHRYNSVALKQYVYCFRPTKVSIYLAGVNIIAALHFNCTIAALCVLSQLWLHVQCSTALSVYLYMHSHIMNCVLTQNHMVNDGVYTDNCRLVFNLVCF